MKNKLLLGLVRLLKRLIPQHEKKERILVVATTALGDTLWATAALENIRMSLPKAYIAVLVSPIGVEVLKNNPWINAVHLLKEPVMRHLWRLWIVLFEERFDTILLFHASQRLVFPLCSLLGASRIIGTEGINKGLDQLLTKRLPNIYQHEIVRRLKIAEEIGVKSVVRTLSFFPKQKIKLEPGPWVALHPGSKDGFKRWPVSHFAEVAQQLKEKTGCKILITGNRSEKKLLQETASKISGAQIHDALSLEQYGALLNQVDLLIANDTGPVHLACALQRPVVALYCSTDPKLCGPYMAKQAIAIAKRPTCTPCLKRKCLAPFCFLQIAPEEVVAAALQFLQG